MYDGDEAVAWCEYGSPAELPNIYHRKQYDEEVDLLPDYRITCIFVDKRYRRRGLSAIALQGTLDLIAAQGGGIVEGYSEQRHGQLRDAPKRAQLCAPRLTVRQSLPSARHPA